MAWQFTKTDRLNPTLSAKIAKIMKQTIRIPLVLALAITLLGVSANELYSQDVNEDVQAIQNLYFDMSKALIEKDWERWQGYWVQDTSLNVLHPGIRDWATGWYAVKSRYLPMFGPDVNMQVELKTDEFKIYTSPKGDFAWALVDLIVTMGENKMQSWQVMVLQKIDGSWKVNLAFDADLPLKE
jgi:hypothetical protein